MLKKYIVPFLVVFATSLQGWANEPAQGSQDPFQIVDCVTVGILDIIKANRDQFETNPEPFYQALDGLLEDVVDFNFIARNVMGPYGQSANKDQLDRFRVTFKEDLIKTYARGLMSYGDQEIVVLPDQEDLAGKKRLTVRQEIRNKDDAYPLNYSFGLNRQGEWKITNLVINGINLGKTFRNQFIQRAGEFDGDIDQVIDGWSATPEKLQASNDHDGSTGS